MMRRHLRSARALLTAVAALWVVANPSSLRAQSIPVADSLLRIGQLARAESLYYAAARIRPHDPIARWALGRYLVARGATRVGATLLEESLKFGGQPTIVGRDLVPAYMAMGNYGALATLAAASPVERARARWLVTHEPRVVAPDSVLVAAYWAPDDSTTLGHIPLRINGRTLEATVSPHVQGIVVTDTTAVARTLHRFENANGAPALFAAADSVAIGRLSLIDVPVTLVRAGEPHGVLIGLDLLSRFAPTFDPVAHRITLHVGGTLATPPAGDRFATLLIGSDYRVVRAGGLASMTSPEIVRLLGEHRWTVDARRGQLIVEP